MNILDKILGRQEFDENPPVLLDIGASGAIHYKWNSIAKYSVCIAFDADEREMGYTIKESRGFKKLYIYNSLVTDRLVSDPIFYLTKSPFCSSLLPPIQENLNLWAFGELFDIESSVTAKAVVLASVLEELGIKKIDWFKADTQGTDLRLFKSLGDERLKQVLAAEFEPGIIDAYEGEDKLHSIMAYMDEHPFWMTSLKIKGSQRVGRDIVNNKLNWFEKKGISALLPASPGWGEVSYMNRFIKDATYLDKRDFLLGWTFSIIEKQYGFAIEIASEGLNRFNDSIFEELQSYALKRVKLSFIRLPKFMFSSALRLVGMVSN